MSNEEIVRAEDVAAVTASVVRTRRRVLAAAVVTPLLAALLAGLLAYRLTSLGVSASVFLAVGFVLLGVPVFVHWWRHYQSILGQLAALDRRVSGGETVHSSQVAFHSYR